MYSDQQMKKLENNLKQYVKSGCLSYKIDTQGAYLNDIIKHSEHVTYYSLQIAKALNLSDKELKSLFESAVYHDIGKAVIPKKILFKTEKLNDYEISLIKSHSVIGSNYLLRNGYAEDVVNAANYHHEKYDGTGYPTGISGHNIPLFARIICVADAFDAMVSHRVYKEAKSIDFALNEIQKCKGTQFDPEIADCFIWLIKNQYNNKKLSQVDNL